MASETKGFIVDVIPGSIAFDLGIEKGDILKSINGQTPKDLIDYRFLTADEEIEIEILKSDGEIWVCDIEKEYDQDIGLIFSTGTFDGIRKCANKCIFCFVDQMPSGMRDSLYVKDDDYRLSFLHGSFITLTNLSETDIDRIIRLRISPLYVSVHTTNPELRVQMLGNKKAALIMNQLTKLAEAGIELHTQIVLCPGINDGKELINSISDLSSLWPEVKSIALVPVGLTKFRKGLYNLRRFSEREASELIDIVNRYQEQFLREKGSPIVYLADEFYIMAKRGVPTAKFYGDFPQLENGVGIVRLFYDSYESQKHRLPQNLSKDKKMVLVTGVLGDYALRPVIDQLNRILNLHLDVIVVQNQLFGEYVTVAGLLTGSDVISAVNSWKIAFPFKAKEVDCILVPSVMCREDKQVFLDGITPAQLEDEIKIPVKVVDTDDGVSHLIDIIMNESS